MRKLISFSLVAFSGVAWGQAPRVLTADEVSHVDAPRNFVINPSAALNTRGVSATGGAGVAQNKVAPTLGTSSDFSLSLVNNGVVTWAIGTTPAAGNCQLKFRYSGMGTGATAELLSGANVVSTVALPLVSTAFQPVSINYPCAGISSFRIKSTATLTGKVGKVFFGEPSNLGQVAQAEYVGGVRYTQACTAPLVTTAGFSDMPGAACPNQVLEGAVTSADSASVTISSAKEGNYFVIYNGIPYGTGGTNTVCYFRFIETTSGSIDGSSYLRTFSSDSVGGQTLFGNFTLLTPGTRTFKIQAGRPEGAGSCRLDPAPAGSPAGLRVYRTPLRSEINMRPDQQPSYGEIRFEGTSSTSNTTSSSKVVLNSAGMNSNFSLKGNAAAGTTCGGASGDFAGCFRNVQPGEYIVVANGPFFANSNVTTQGTAGSCFYDIFNATDSKILASGQAVGIANGTSAGEDYISSIMGTLTVTSLKPSLLLAVRAAKNSAQGICFARGNGTTSNVESFPSISLIPVSQNSPTPLLVGSVTSNSSGLERVERLVFSNSSSACPVTRQSGSWISGSGVRNAAGDCTFSIAAGTFSGTPTCTCSTDINSVIGTCSVHYGTTSATALRIHTRNSSNTAIDTDAHVTCQGPR